jgi:SnoaL-like domain
MFSPADEMGHQHVGPGALEEKIMKESEDPELPDRPGTAGPGEVSSSVADWGQSDPGQLLVSGRESFDSKSMEAKVQELVDREEIRELVATYAHRIAHGPAAGDLFADDGAYINRGTPELPPREVRGRADLDEYFCDRTGWAERPLPMIHNHIISVHGDEATGICSVEIRATAKGTSILASGYYLDRYRRDGRRWKFVERDVSFFHWVPLQHGWAKGPDRDG